MKVIRNLVLIPFGLIIGLTVDGLEQPRHSGTPMAAIHMSMAWGGTAASERVPFVACESDGMKQIVAQPALKDRGQAPVVPRSVAHNLAYYASAHLAVLAPRGWHCFELYGTDGSILIVTPEPHSADDLRDRNLTGPGILLDFSWSGFSGRDTVVDVAARLFPAKVQGLLDEWPRDKSDFTFGPYPDDILMRRSDTDVEYETPANKDGMGTTTGLVKNAEPIRGMAIMMDIMDQEKNKYPSVMLLVVRTPPNLRRLVGTIKENTRQHVHQFVINVYP